MGKISEGKSKALSVLSDMGGWVGYRSLRQHGASPASAIALFNEGIIERREFMTDAGNFAYEYRMPSKIDLKQDLEKEREEFEKLMGPDWETKALSQKNSNGEYVNDYIQSHWQGWLMRSRLEMEG